MAVSLQRQPLILLRKNPDLKINFIRVVIIINKLEELYHSMWFRRLIKVLLIFLISLTGIMAILIIYLNTTSSHIYLTKKINNILSKSDLPIHIESVGSVLPASVRLKGVTLLSTQNDTIIYAERLSSGIKIFPLLKRKAVLENVNLNGINISLKRGMSDKALNLVESFSDTGNSSDKDAKNPEKSWEVSLSDAKLYDLNFSICDSITSVYIDQKIADVKIKIDRFSILNKEIKIRSIELNKSNGSITMGQPINKETGPGSFDWSVGLSRLTLTDINSSFNDPVKQLTINLKIGLCDIATNEIDLKGKQLDIKKIRLESSDLKLNSENRQDQDETHLVHPLSPFPWKLKGKNIDIKDLNIYLDVSSNEQTSGLLENLKVSGLKMNLSDFILNGTDIKFNFQGLGCDLGNGFSIKNSKASFESDKNATSFGLLLESVHSRLNIESNASGNIFDILNKPSSLTGSITKTDASISFNDISYFLPDLVENPYYLSISKSPLNIRGDILINAGKMSFSDFMLYEEGNFKFKLNGSLESFLQPELTSGDVNVNLTDVNLQWLSEILKDLNIQNSLPELTRISLSANLSGLLFSPDFKIFVTSDLGNINIKGNADLQNQDFYVSSSFDRIMLGKILGIAHLGLFIGELEVTGNGFDSKSLSANGSLLVDTVQFNGYDYTNIKVKSKIGYGNYSVNVNTTDESLNSDLNFLINSEYHHLTMDIAGSVSANLCNLHFIEDSLTLATNISASYLQDNNILNSELLLSDLKLSSPRESAVVKNVNISFKADTVKSSFKGDADFFNFIAEVEKPLSHLRDITEGSRKYIESFVDPQHLQSESRISYLPDMTGKINMVYHKILNILVMGKPYYFSSIDCSIEKISSEKSVNIDFKGTGIGFSVFDAGILSASLVDSSGSLNFNLSAEPVTINSLPVNRIELTSSFYKWNSKSRFSVIGKQNERVYDFNISTEVDSSDIIFRIPSKQLVMNRVQWYLDEPEVIFLNRSDKRFFPTLRMHTENSSLRFISEKENDIKKYILELDNMTIASLVNKDLVPGNPSGSVTGTINFGTLSKSGWRINSDLKMKDFLWSDLKYANISINSDLFSELPGKLKFDLDAVLDSSVISVAGTKDPDGTGFVNTSFEEVPINTIGPFVKKYLSDIRGKFSGYFNVVSKNYSQDYKGELNVENANIRIKSLNSAYKIPHDKILFTGNNIIFNKFRVLDSLNNTLLIDGSIDLKNKKSIVANVEISSSKLQVMNTAKDENSSFYGDIFIDSKLTVKGPLSSPVLRGRLLLAPGTEVFYSRKEDLSISESEKIIRFASIKSADTNIDAIKNANILHNNASIETTVEIDPATKLNFNLSEKLFNINLMIKGGGVLNYSMLVNNQNNLAGKYAISEGTADVKMVGWPNKAFRISQDGYIRWDGNIEDPEINFEAFNRVRSSYRNPVDGKDRNVDFNVALKISNRLSDLNIVFNINTPDQYLMSIINTLSPEDQMKQAITILLFQKIDLPGISTSTDYVTEQVNQMVASQLNQLTKTTIKGIDISFGLDSYTQATQSGGEETKTSLSYEVKRAVMNDRAQIEFSGRLNDLNNQPGASDLSLNNFSFEYRLDSAATKFLKVYNEHTYEDVFEGEVVKTGVGLTYRKSYRHFGDIWRRQKKSKKSGTTIK